MAKMNEKGLIPLLNYFDIHLHTLPNPRKQTKIFLLAAFKQKPKILDSFLGSSGNGIIFKHSQTIEYYLMNMVYICFFREVLAKNVPPLHFQTTNT